jgi:hypothetical protein
MEMTMRIEFCSGPAETADVALEALAGLLEAFGAKPEALPVLWELPGGACEARVTAAV